MQKHEIEQMRAEDKMYGEKQKSKHQVQKKSKVKNQINYKHFSASDLMAMEDTENT